MVLLSGKSFKYKLRWKFEYLDKSKDVFGCWLSKGTKENQTTNYSLQSLSRVLIQGYETRTGKILNLMYVSGQDFLKFEWIAICSTPMPKPGEEYKLTPTIIGAKIITNRFVYSYFVDGSSKTEPSQEV